MNQNLSTLELIVLGAVAVIVLFLFVPGLKRLQQQSQEAEKDWAGVLIPMGGVVLFVIVLLLII